MFLKLRFVVTFIFLSQFASADTDWRAYLRSKGYKCSLTDEQVNAQAAAQVDRFRDAIKAELVKRGSDVQDVSAPRDQIEVGTFPKMPGFDFYVDAKTMTATIQRLPLQIQTTLQTQGAPVLKPGLWFPLVVNDTGDGKTCRLERIVVDEDQRSGLPSIDLVLGTPPRVVVPNIVQVVEFTGQPKPAAPAATPQLPVAPQEEPKAAPEKAPDSQVDSDKPSSRSRAEWRERRREQRRERRERSRRHRRYRHYRSRAEDVPKAAEPPSKTDECTGDKSLWKSVTCSLQGK